MSLDLINHTLTTSTTSKSGVITWSNPAVDVKINSKGKVIRKGRVMVCEGKQTKYNLYITLENGSVKRHVATFNGLFSKMVLGEKLSAKTLVLKDKKKGFIESNVDIIPSYKLRSNTIAGDRSKARNLYENGVTLEELVNIFNVTQKTIRVWLKDDTISEQATEEAPKSLVLETTQEDAALKQTTLNTNTQEFEMDADNKQYYTLHEDKNEHITEDGAVFPTRELAEWHQNNVSKGKGNAQIVLDYNGGYVLAEQIFLQEVKYNKKQPYVNFVDVMNNNKGIVSNVQEEHCVFDKLDSKYGFHSDVCFMSLRKGIPDKVSKHQAIKIQEALEQYSNAVESLGISVTRLESLLKQIK